MQNRQCLTTMIGGVVDRNREISQHVTILYRCKLLKVNSIYWYLVAHNHAAGTSVTLLSNLILSIFQANRIVKASAVKLTNYYTDVR